MYYEVYLDVVFLINLIFDFVLIRITGSIVKRKSTLFRCFLASFAGTLLLCVVIVLSSARLWEHPVIAMSICNFITVCIAYYRRKEKLYKMLGITAVFFVVSFLLGGILNAMYSYTIIGYYGNILNNAAKENAAVPWQFVCLGAFVCCVVGKPIILLLHKMKDTGSIYWEVTIYMDRGEKVITALADTGNHLKEPISGKPVHVIEIGVIEELLEPEFVVSVKKMYEEGVMENGLYREGGIRMIPFKAVGTPNGKILVGISVKKIKFKNHTIEYETENPYVALYDGKLAQDSSYHMLLHGNEMMRRS